MVTEKTIQRALADVRRRQQANGASGPLCQVALDAVETVLRRKMAAERAARRRRKTAR